jgi:hypothetical protein
MVIKQDHYQFGLSILTSLLLASSGALAGNVSTTFSPGGTLTATQMTKIKDAVNNNDANITNIQDAVNDIDSVIAIIVTQVTDTVNDINSVIARLFGGDGSAGDLIVPASESAIIDWEASPPSNPYFNNITIDFGQTLTVPAGTTIRCRGNFINNGTLSVATNLNGGSHTAISNVVFPVATARISAPHPGDSIRAASPPASTFDIGDQPFLPGGQGGGGIPRTRALTSYNLFQYGGGGGSGHLKAGTDGNGGDGGGLVKINCNGTITNNGLIDADAPTSVSGGGGGGGIVVLASLTEIINTATITANGGDGEASETDHGNAGGGGGGIIVLAAPSIPDLSGTTSVLGGSADSEPLSGFISQASSGGGGGGASGGDGGTGGSLSVGGGTPSGSDGMAGHVIQIFAIPLPY